MDTELFELCKEVYKRLPEWETKSRYLVTLNGNHDIWHWENAQWVAERVPLYTSDYLLEKLPRLLDIDGMTFSVSVQSQVAPPDYAALYTHTSVVGGKLVSHSTRFINVADTPLKALLKLIIALDDAGELK